MKNTFYMRQVVILFFLLFSHSFDLMAQDPLENINSLKKVNQKERNAIEARLLKAEEVIHRVQSHHFSDRKIRRIIAPVLSAYQLNSYEELLVKFDQLSAQDQAQINSLNVQLALQDSLLNAVSNASESSFKIQQLTLENSVLRAIKNYCAFEIDCFNSNTINTIDQADLYYYDLTDFQQPKVFVYNSLIDSNHSQYWEVSANAKRHTLTTKVFNMHHELLENRTEKLDSFGSKLTHYQTNGKVAKMDTLEAKNNVYLWKSAEKYAYEFHFKTANGTIDHSKSRTFLRKDSIVVMGKMSAVLLYKDEYSSYNSKSKEKTSYTQYVYFAEGIGNVQTEASVSNKEKENEVIYLQLDAILTKKEWRKQKRV